MWKLKRDTMNIEQIDISLPPFQKGFHLVSHYIDEAVAKSSKIKTGLCHIFIHHTSASLTLNENADPDVRKDFDTFFNHLVPENFPKFRHTTEGADDMPAHIKSSLLGASVSVPLKNGRLYTGIWQGVYLCEHRVYGGSRKLTITVIGQE
jgi:secondary thiamine-phosphate synthase enzyme